MPKISFATLGLGLVVLVTVALVAVGVQDAPAVVPVPAPVNSLPVGGLVLTSTSVELPAETEGFPVIGNGPSADAVNANCTSCHSASMALNQPKLTAAQWSETVTKMREVFKAPIAAGDDAAIVAYLAAASAAHGEGTAGAADATG